VIVFLGARRGWSDLQRSIDVPTLIPDASLIVVGEVTDAWEDGREASQFNGIYESGRLIRARLRIVGGNSARQRDLLEVEIGICTLQT